MTCETE